MRHSIANLEKQHEAQHSKESTQVKEVVACGFWCSAVSNSQSPRVAGYRAKSGHKSN
jgi:hypothetical protein